MDISLLKKKNGKETVFINHADIDYTNFAGEEKQNNRAGDRNFCIMFKRRNGDLDPNVADWCEEFVKEGWNIKFRDYNIENGKWERLVPGVDYNVENLAIMTQVKVSYDNYPPKISTKEGTEGARVFLNEDDIANLDYLEFDDVKLELNRSYWKVNGKEGVKPYLREAMFILADDPFSDSPTKEVMPSDDELMDDIPFK